MAASEWTRVGGVSGRVGGYGIVHRCSETGEVSLNLTRTEMLFDAAGAIEMAELLLRAAMPGQPPAMPVVDPQRFGALAREVERLAAEIGDDDG